MSASIAVLTVATVDFTAAAVATLRSARRTGTYDSFRLFTLDAVGESIGLVRAALGKDAEWIEVFGPYDLGRFTSAFLAAFEYYDAIEISCFAKYLGISHVFARSDATDICLCVDADTRFIADMREVIEAMGPSAAFLTPHLLGPAGEDIEHDIMTHGWVNAGVVAFQKANGRTSEILGWLIERVSRRGFLAPQLGFSLDQAWLSALPILFPKETYLCTHPGVNVAYWNSDERPLTRTAEGISAGGSPLLVFHYSAYDVTRPNRLSRHSKAAVPDDSLTAHLLREYRSGLAEAYQIKEKLSGVPTISASLDPLVKRIRVASQRSGVNLTGPGSPPGWFSRIGWKVDSMLRAVLSRSER